MNEVRTPTGRVPEPTRVRLTVSAISNKSDPMMQLWGMRNL